ncbi:MAG: FUSC family protein [Gemmatimonadaceae bacterium]|nr:FUSC family protein [Gemmatimonadaceae bacterium]
MRRPLGPTLHTVRAATALARPRPAYVAGLRAAVATVVPLMAAQVLGTGGATWTSLGGFNGALADRGGPYRTRAMTMSAVALCCAGAMVIGTLASGHVALAIPLTFAVAFATCLGRAWGTPGVSVGGATLTTFVIALAVPASAGDGAFLRAGYEMAGGLWAMAVALVVWPLQPYRPARLAVAQSYRALAAYAADVALHLRATLDTDTSELPAGSAAVRTALEDARLALTQSRRGRPGTSGREERLVVLGEIVDQLFAHVVAIAEAIDSIHAVARVSSADAAVGTALDDITRTAHALAGAVETEGEPEPIAVPWNGDALRGAIAGAIAADPAAAVHYQQAAAVLDRGAQYAGVASVTVAALNAGHGAASPTPADVAGVPVAAVISEPDEPDSALTTLRAMLSWDSLIFRYALRVAVVTALAVALGDALGLKRGYWMTITVIVILQPYTGVTAQRALQRVVGTVLGGLLTAALGALFHDPRAILVLSFVFAAACVALLPVNYAAFSIFLTPTFVLLAEASAGDWHLASIRVLNTLLGGALALAGSRLLWPSPEKTRLPGFMAAALHANRDYLAAVVALFDDRSEAAGRALRGSRRRIGLATVNAEESFQRLLGESSGSGGRLASAMTFLTYTRRLTASIAALALARHSEQGGGSDGLRRFTDTATGVLADLAESIEGGRAPAPLPSALASEAARAREAGLPPLLRARLDRLARQIRLLHDAIGRWTLGEPDPASPP